ncbi:hypothetical protein [Jannaschia aquimarina]|uniref:Uncharacterized protein n=1 Tax=Jannaschia aquimarina TaxID=935700 RepID=A0A0D1EMC1_9RHOB|nr:hypothetical protein [Jannaschia aquimarina]KIT18136.1 hypothetical protein jaqu_00700 [Jannaschia aquimarina]SNT30238.1 hypothetical protein SAMN05421775_110127 [Jannaschia aquimarina]
MTAIDGLERLESPAIWHPAEGEQRRDVYVSVGEAELVIFGTDEAPLSHWSLPAMRRLNPGAMPARYAPGQRADEELEIEETEMVAVLERVLDAVERGRPKRGRLRFVLSSALTAAAILGLLAWLPGAIRDHAIAVLPPAKQAEIGDRLLVELGALTGPPCTGPLGDEALTRLRLRLFPNTPVRMRVVQDLPAPALALPGGLLILSNEVLVARDDPEVAAGHFVAARATAHGDGPLGRFIDGLGTWGTARLLMSGDVRQQDVAEAVERLILTPPPLPADEALRGAFAEAGLAWAPWAQATGRPVRAAASGLEPALDDAGWQSLRGICES